MKRMRILITAAMLTAAAATSFAEQAPLPANPGGQYNDDMGIDNDTPSGRGGAPSEKKREEVRKKIEAVRIWRLTEELKLDANTSAKLSSLLSSIEQKRRDSMREQMENTRELRSSLKSGKPDEAKIKSLLEKIESNHHIMQELRDREWKGLQEILTIEQQARFLIFQQEFQRQMRGMIVGARGEGTGKGGRGQGPGQGMGGGSYPGRPGGPPEN